MPIVHVQQSSGRTVKQKRALVKSVTQAVCDSYEIDPSAVTVFLIDMAPTDWGKGGVLYDDQQRSSLE